MKMTDTVTDYVKPSRIHAIATEKPYKAGKRKARLTPYNKGKDRQKVCKDVLEGY